LRQVRARKLLGRHRLATRSRAAVRPNAITRAECPWRRRRLSWPHEHYSGDHAHRKAIRNKGDHLVAG
jgi:hypothetical protein